MSEKIYALLLRLHSSRFREAYGDEALQLFRDRARDERGFFAGLRLWFDLLADLAISVSRGYVSAKTELVSNPAQGRLDGIPSFRILGGESPSRGALLLGGGLSLVMLAVFPVSMSHSGGYRPPRASILEPVRSAYARWSSSGHPSPQAADGAEEKTMAFGQPARTAARLRQGDVKPSESPSKPIPAQSAFVLPEPPGPQPKLRSTPSATIPVGERVTLDAAQKRRLIGAVIANVKEHYIDPGAAQKIADALLAHEKNGDYETIPYGPVFADLLTRHLRDVTHDMHLVLVYSQVPLPERRLGPFPESAARYREAMKQENCTFERVQILPHNVGYLKLNSFPDPSVCQKAATAAMASLNNADAIIFDLRDNRGGYPGMVMQIAAYLFDHPEYMYNPRENTTQESWTQSPVPGNRLADKPVYLLTSAKTVSAAEHFSYNLKMLKRATLVGETTRGSAHSGVFYRIDEHFGMGIPEVKPINPYSKTDWEGTGVEPDVKVKAADALETAKKLATGKALKRANL